jgi:hypothetical protein
VALVPRRLPIPLTQPRAPEERPKGRGARWRRRAGEILHGVQRGGRERGAEARCSPATDREFGTTYLPCPVFPTPSPTSFLHRSSRHVHLGLSEHIRLYRSTTGLASSQSGRFRCPPSTDSRNCRCRTVSTKTMDSHM